MSKMQRGAEAPLERGVSSLASDAPPTERLVGHANWMDDLVSRLHSQVERLGGPVDIETPAAMDARGQLDGLANRFSASLYQLNVLVDAVERL